MIKRRNIIKFACLAPIMSVLNCSQSTLSTLIINNPMAGVLDMVNGGGGDWTSIAENFNKGFGIVRVESFVILDVLAELADALGLAEQSALVRGEATRLQDTGDSFGGDELDAVSEISLSTGDMIIKKTAEAEVLSAEQKVKMEKAAIKYIPSLIKGIGAAIIITKAVQSASAAGTPGITDGVSVIRLATKIPTLGPAAVQYITDSVEVGQSLTEIMQTKDVAVPDTSGLVMDLA